MGNKPFSRYFFYKEMTSDDSSELQKFAISCYGNGKRLPAIFGGSIQDNRNLAKAYSENKELYPYAYLIFDKDATENAPIGCLVAQRSGDMLDITIIITGDLSHFKTIVVLGEFRKFVFEEGEFQLTFNSDDVRVMEILDSYGLLYTPEEEDYEESSDEVAE